MDSRPALSTKFTVRSSFCKDSHLCRFCILVRLLTATLRYCSSCRSATLVLQMQLDNCCQRESWAAQAHALHYFELVKFLQPADQVALQIQNFQMFAQVSEKLDLLNVQLVQRNFLQSCKDAIIVFSSLQHTAQLSRCGYQTVSTQPARGRSKLRRTFRIRLSVILVIQRVLSRTRCSVSLQINKITRPTPSVAPSTSQGP